MNLKVAYPLSKGKIVVNNHIAECYNTSLCPGHSTSNEWSRLWSICMYSKVHTANNTMNYEVL